MDLYYSADFQCPWTGVPVQLVWDLNTGVISAQIHRYLYYEDDEFYSEEIAKETEEWCKSFRRYADNIDEANDIAEEYECWF